MELFPSVFLGDKTFANDLEWLRNNGIGAVVNVTSEVRNFFEPKRRTSSTSLSSSTSSTDTINSSQSSSQSSESTESDIPDSNWKLKEEKNDSNSPTDDNKNVSDLKEREEGSSSPSIKLEESEEELPVCATPDLSSSTSSSPPPSSLPLELPDLLYKRIPVTDSQETKLDVFFDETADFISEQVNEGKKVLVHCQLGMSRSPSILLAYAIRSLGMTLSAAVESVSTKSSFNINDGFQRQLMQYELKKLGLDTNSYDFFGKRNRTPFVVRYSPATPIPQKKKKAVLQNGELERKKKKKKKKKKSKKESMGEEDKKDETKKRKNKKNTKIAENQSILSFSSQTLSVIDHNGIVISSTPTTTTTTKQKDKRDRKEKKKKKKRSSPIEAHASQSPNKKQKKTSRDSTISFFASSLTPSLPRSRSTSNSSKTAQDVAAMPAVLFDAPPQSLSSPSSSPSPKTKSKALRPQPPILSSPLQTDTSVLAGSTTSTTSTTSTAAVTLDSSSSNIPVAIVATPVTSSLKTAKSQTPRRVSYGSLTILDLIQAGVLNAGDEVSFRGEVTKLLEDGTMNYKGHLFTSVSKWATTVIRTTGGSQNSQVNGWRCTSVRYNKTLADLRELYLGGKLPTSSSEVLAPSSSSSSSPSLSPSTSSSSASASSSTPSSTSSSTSLSSSLLSAGVQDKEELKEKDRASDEAPKEEEAEDEVQKQEGQVSTLKQEEDESYPDLESESESESQSQSESDSEESSEEEDSEEDSDDEEEEEEELAAPRNDGKKEIISLMDGVGVATEGDNDSAGESEEGEEGEMEYGEGITITSPHSVFFSPSYPSSTTTSMPPQVLLTSSLLDVGMIDEKDNGDDGDADYQEAAGERSHSLAFVEEGGGLSSAEVSDEGGQKMLSSLEEQVELDADDIVNQMLSFE